MSLRTEKLWLTLKGQECEYCGGGLKGEVSQFRTLTGINRLWTGEMRCSSCKRAFDVNPDDLNERYGEP